MKTDVYEHVQQKCNLEPIRELLRTIKDRSEKANREILLSGQKQDVVQNLRRAVESNFVQVDEVFTMLRNSEETGHQHILLLCPADSPDAPASMDADAVASALFEKPVSSQFPRFEYSSEGYEWADFRYNSTMGKSWIAKAYGKEVYKASTGATRIEDLGGGKLEEIREYEYRETKTVLVAKWNADAGIFELRIDISGIQNTQTLDERRSAFWRLFEPAFNRSNFVGYDVENLLKTLVYDRGTPENQARYSLSKVELTDPRSGLVRVIPSSLEDFDKDPGRKNALEAMKKGKFMPSLARIDWKPADDAPQWIKEPLTTVLEKTPNGPELRILKKVPPEVYNYVFSQIRSRLDAVS